MRIILIIEHPLCEGVFAPAQGFCGCTGISASEHVLGAAPAWQHYELGQGVNAAFSLKLVKTGWVSVELGTAINKVEDLRLIADDTGDRIDVAQVKWAHGQAALFVQAMQQLIDATAPAAKS